MRNNNVLLLTSASVRWEPTINTISQEKRSTTIVRMAVATLESVFLTPILERIAVNPAKIADPKANKTHISATLLSFLVYFPSYLPQLYPQPFRVCLFLFLFSYSN